MSTPLYETVGPGMYRGCWEWACTEVLPHFTFDSEPILLMVKGRVGTSWIEWLRVSADGTVHLNPDLDLSQLAEMPRDVLCAIQAMVDRTLELKAVGMEL